MGLWWMTNRAAAEDITVVQGNKQEQSLQNTKNNLCAGIGTGTATVFQTPHGGVEWIEIRHVESTGSEESLEELAFLI